MCWIQYHQLDFFSLHCHLNRWFYSEYVEGISNGMLWDLWTLCPSWLRSSSRGASCPWAGGTRTGVGCLLHLNLYIHPAHFHSRALVYQITESVCLSLSLSPCLSLSCQFLTDGVIIMNDSWCPSLLLEFTEHKKIHEFILFHQWKVTNKLCESIIWLHYDICNVVVIQLDPPQQL